MSICPRKQILRKEMQTKLERTFLMVNFTDRHLSDIGLLQLRSGIRPTVQREAIKTLRVLKYMSTAHLEVGSFPIVQLPLVIYQSVKSFIFSFQNFKDIDREVSLFLFTLKNCTGIFVTDNNFFFLFIFCRRIFSSYFRKGNQLCNFCSSCSQGD